MEDYVTFEQAKALKTLGFDWITYCAYDKIYKDNRPWELRNYHTPQNHNLAQYSASAPTLSQAQKWLREVKRIDLDITLYRVIDATKDVPTIKRYYNCEIAFGEEDDDLDEDFDTYEQALSAGIDAALELLK